MTKKFDWQAYIDRNGVAVLDALPAGWWIDFMAEYPNGYRWAESPEGKRALVKTGLGKLKTSKGVKNE